MANTEIKIIGETTLDSEVFHRLSEFVSELTGTMEKHRVWLQSYRRQGEPTFVFMLEDTSQGTTVLGLNRVGEQFEVLIKGDGKGNGGGGGDDA